MSASALSIHMLVGHLNIRLSYVVILKLCVSRVAILLIARILIIALRCLQLYRNSLALPSTLFQSSVGMTYSTQLFWGKPQPRQLQRLCQMQLLPLH